MGVAAGTMAAAAYPTLAEPRWTEVTHNRIRLGLAKPVRVLHLADFHASFLVPMSLIEQSIRLGLEQRPDFACLTGDFITFQHDFDAARYVTALRRLTGAVPTYAVLGNHDGGKWAPERGGFGDHYTVERILADSGVRLLHNRAERVRVNGAALSLVGTGDLWSEEIDADAAFSGAEPGLPTVLLAHNPDSKELLRDRHWNVMLSGHTHGGQVIIPFEGPQFAPVEDKRYVAGLGRWGAREIFVTRGVGNLGGVRFLCRPEVSLLTLG